MPDASTPIANLFRLDGKTALVTAAAGGFGSAISLALAASGADVAVTDIREDAVAQIGEKVRGQGRRALSAVLDVGSPADIERVVQQVVAEFGRIDVLVNIACAAVLRPVLEMTLADFDQTMASCLRGAFLLSQAVGKVMVQRQMGGSVVHISSIASARALGRGTGMYAASKAGVNALVRETAVEWAPHRIRVNAIAPCQFRTLMFEKVLDNPQFGGREKLTARMIGKIPLGRFGEPHEIIGPTLFLASEASSMVTGHVLFVDGGFMAA
jgi:NAD(P)-dependent dehydrogenase (short-subunit alcohol dehydrogenase family)